MTSQSEKYYRYQLQRSPVMTAHNHIKFGTHLCQKLTTPPLANQQSTVIRINHCLLNGKLVNQLTISLSVSFQSSFYSLGLP